MHDKIKALLPKEKEHRVFECNGAYNGTGCYEDWCDVKTCTSKDATECKIFNQALAEVHAKIPEIVALVEGEVGEKIMNHPINMNHFTKKYQFWADNNEGYFPTEFDTLEECLLFSRYWKEFYITQKVELEVKEK